MVGADEEGESEFNSLGQMRSSISWVSRFFVGKGSSAVRLNLPTYSVDPKSI